MNLVLILYQQKSTRKTLGGKLEFEGFETPIHEQSYQGRDTTGNFRKCLCRQLTMIIIRVLPLRYLLKVSFNFATLQRSQMVKIQYQRER